MREWLIVSAYKPPDQSKSVFLESLSKIYSIYIDTYQNKASLGSLNMTAKDKNLQLFAGFFDLELLIKKPTCFKGSPSCIDLTITNRAVSLKSQTLKAFPERKLYRD